MVDESEDTAEEPPLSEEEKARLRQQIEENRWKHATEDKCLNCGADILVPMLGGFECKLCNEKFWTFPTELIGHHDFEIDPERAKNYEAIFGTFSIIIGRKGEEFCPLCGETYPKGITPCPGLMDFALHYYTVPDNERLPASRHRIIEMLLASPALAKERLLIAKEKHPKKWIAVVNSGMLVRLRKHWGENFLSNGEHGL